MSGRERRNDAPSAGPILVTGGAGLLGRTLLATAPRHLPVHATWHRHPLPWSDSHRIDLASEEDVHSLFDAVRPCLVVHTAYRKVDGERNIVAATRNVARAAERVGAALVHVSTDLVFDGSRGPYAEQDAPSPVTEYGAFKTAAETQVLRSVADATVVRTSLITAVSPLDANSAWVAEGLREGRRVQLFVDEIRCPIGARDLAEQLWELVALPASERRGAWHLVGPEALSRYALGLLVADHERLDRQLIEPVSASTHPEPRPKDVRLCSSRAHQLRHKPMPMGALFSSSQAHTDRDSARAAPTSP
jgi:dTDP-4-dehydrorhamnose reductase